MLLIQAPEMAGGLKDASADPSAFSRFRAAGLSDPTRYFPSGCLVSAWVFPILEGANVASSEPSALSRARFGRLVPLTVPNVPPNTISRPSGPPLPRLSES